MVQLATLQASVIAGLKFSMADGVECLFVTDDCNCIMLAAAAAAAADDDDDVDVFQWKKMNHLTSED